MSTDAAIISQAISTYRNGETITNLQARVIASAWHSGQYSNLYRLTSTGTITPDLADELRADVADELGALLDYVVTHGPRGPQAGWSDLNW